MSSISSGKSSFTELLTEMPRPRRAPRDRTWKQRPRGAINFAAFAIAKVMLVIDELVASRIRDFAQSRLRATSLLAGGERQSPCIDQKAGLSTCSLAFEKASTY
jgi:hypothetical protein